MRTLARVAASSLVLLCAALALVAVAVAAIGIAGTRSAASQGNAIADDELTTAVVTSELARDIDAAYAAGQAAVLTTDRAERARLLATLYTSLLPAVDARLFALERLHAADPPAEHADMTLFIRQWTAVRDRLSPLALTSGAVAAGRLAAAYPGEHPRPARAPRRRRPLPGQAPGQEPRRASRAIPRRPRPDALRRVRAPYPGRERLCPHASA